MDFAGCVITGGVCSFSLDLDKWINEPPEEEAELKLDSLDSFLESAPSKFEAEKPHHRALAQHDFTSSTTTDSPKQKKKGKKEEEGEEEDEDTKRVSECGVLCIW